MLGRQPRCAERGQWLSGGALGATGSSSPTLARRLGLLESTLLGLGAIVGTGVFVSIALAAGVAGAGVIPATALAALVAAANALSSAQLAASHPVSGGTYEYGYRYLSPALGFTAGWMFLCAKTASAAAAALGFAGYLTIALDVAPSAQVPLAATIVATVTLLVAGGINRSSRANAVIVAVTLSSLLVFCLAGLPVVAQRDGLARLSEGGYSVDQLLHATALMFVAYTGYGRIATLGEEVIEPRRTIPRAILVTLIVSGALYVAVAAVATGAVGAERLGAAAEGRAAPLAIVASSFGVPGVPQLVALGAMTAMLGVLLNLVLGLSRVVLAMARRRDLPAVLSRVEPVRETPRLAVLATGAAVLGLTLLGSLQVAWSFSAFTVLVYYAITNLAALRLAPADRLYPRRIAVAGLLTCLSLAFFVERGVWVSGLAVLAAGLLWHVTARTLARHKAEETEG
jgi:basic amino acid/polyamine antiporter, APA family